MHYLELMQLMQAFLPTAGASLVAAVTHQVEIVAFWHANTGRNWLECEQGSSV